MIPGYELILECRFGNEIKTTKTSKGSNLIKFNIFYTKKYKLVYLVMVCELILILVINKCRTILYTKLNTNLHVLLVTYGANVSLSERV